MKRVLMGAVSALMVMTAAHQSSAQALGELDMYYADPSQPDISGIWSFVPSASTRSTPVPLFTPEYQERWDTWRAAMARGESSYLLTNEMRQNCIPTGLPGDAQGSPYLREIIQMPGRVMILQEDFSAVRRIPTNGQFPELIDPAGTFYGTSAGTWEGDTFVVETVALHEATGLLGPAPHGAHSPEARTVERYTRVSPTELRVELTVYDEIALTEPFSAVTIYENLDGTEMIENFCVIVPGAPGVVDY